MFVGIPIKQHAVLVYYPVYSKRRFVYIIMFFCCFRRFLSSFVKAAFMISCFLCVFSNFETTTMRHLMKVWIKHDRYEKNRYRQRPRGL